MDGPWISGKMWLLIKNLYWKSLVMLWTSLMQVVFVRILTSALYDVTQFLRFWNLHLPLCAVSLCCRAWHCEGVTPGVIWANVFFLIQFPIYVKHKVSHISCKVFHIVFADITLSVFLTLCKLLIYVLLVWFKQFWVKRFCSHIVFSL